MPDCVGIRTEHIMNGNQWIENKIFSDVGKRLIDGLVEKGRMSVRPVPPRDSTMENQVGLLFPHRRWEDAMELVVILSLAPVPPHGRKGRYFRICAYCGYIGNRGTYLKVPSTLPAPKQTGQYPSGEVAFLYLHRPPLHHLPLFPSPLPST